MSSSSVSSWVVLCLLAVLTKLSSSVDDVAWLLPYINSQRAAINAILYIFLMECVVGVAIAAGLGGREAMSSILNEEGYWTSERVLSLISGCLLTSYAIYLFYDWWTELEDDDDSASEPDCKPATTITDDAVTKCDQSLAAAGSGSGSGIADSQQTADPEGQIADPSHVDLVSEAHLRRRQRGGGGGRGAWTEAHTAAQEAARVRQEDVQLEEESPPNESAGKSDPNTCSLVAVALLGSLDDFCVFFGLLLADTFHPLQLSIGVLVGSALVVAFCKGATFFEPVVWLLERIPLWAVIGCFSIWTFVSTFVEF